ncbi:murein biosynthesis integral membrane protein MurJ [Virgisporangium ochraceum]|uniref:Lipid II flippase MurJ n=1 Tax=Virgisporangium ochraceum TaxID=65505 RepID=A0A8J3ZLQ8_9ACTN|nr:murein biosynthesis integral membrane protein MurJ [Virgisporangium ochraceum]GIJ66194.1 lipid II flippase MurJ [Virgisporangium ochraceum]
MSRPGDPDETVAAPAGTDPEQTVVVPPVGDFDQTVTMAASPVTALDTPIAPPLLVSGPSPADPDARPSVDETIVMAPIPDGGAPHPPVHTHRARHAAPPTAVGAARVPEAPPGGAARVPEAPRQPYLPPHMPSAATGHASVPAPPLHADRTMAVGIPGIPGAVPPPVTGHAQAPTAVPPPVTGSAQAPTAVPPPVVGSAQAPTAVPPPAVGSARVPEAPAVPPTTDGTTGPDSSVVPPVTPPPNLEQPNLGQPGLDQPVAAGPPDARPTEAAAQAAAPAEARSVARNSAVMAAGSIVSRLTGFLRAAAISAALGAGLVADDYQLAITLPNMVFELLVGGVLSSVIVPILVRTRKADADGGQAYTQRLLTLAVIALGVATALAVAAAPVFTELLTWSNDRIQDEDKRLITDLAYLILPAIFCYGMAALIGAVLNSRGHFAAPMWTPILNNFVVIATAGVFILVTRGDLVEPNTISRAQILVLGLGTMSGIVVQAAGLLPALRRVGFRWKLRFDFRALGLGEMGRLASWMLLFVIVSQIGLFVVIGIAKAVGTDGEAGVIVFQNAFLIFMMAHGIVAVSVLTALMPRLSGAAADGRHQDLVGHLNSGLRLVSVVLVPITAAYLVLGTPMAVTLFQWGNYNSEAALATGPVIAVAGLGLVPYAVMQLQQFAFYALRDTRTPALLNVPVVALRVGVDLLFFWLLPTAAVTAALMGGSALSFVFGALVSIRLLRRKLGYLGLRRVASALVKLVGAAAIAALPTYLLVDLLSGEFGTGKGASFVQLLVGGALLFGLYYVCALMFRVAEVRDLTRMVRGRLGRSG